MLLYWFALRYVKVSGELVTQPVCQEGYAKLCRRNGRGWQRLTGVTRAWVGNNYRQSRPMSTGVRCLASRHCFVRLTADI